MNLCDYNRSNTAPNNASNTNSGDNVIFSVQKDLKSKSVKVKLFMIKVKEVSF